MKKKSKKNIKSVDMSRPRQVSIVIQPKMNASYWLENHTDKEIEKTLMSVKYPLVTEIKLALSECQAQSVSGATTKLPIAFAFGTETSVETKIPHYQCWIKYPIQIRKTSILDFLQKRFDGRIHLVVESIYGNDYRNYCLKQTSKFDFDSDYYWNHKYDSEGKHKPIPRLMDLRKNLKNVANNLFTGQKLLKRIALSEPDDRSGFWLGDPLGNTGKTAFFQSIIDEVGNEGLYLRISSGMDRLSANLRRKIKTRLENGKGYPKYIWINFGRTVSEDAIKAFNDFGEQILDGMLDDNFANTGDGDFIGLPYMNLIVTANTPPNLNSEQLTSDRLKLLTFFPIYKNNKLVDNFLIPIHVEIRVRILKQFVHNFQYKYVVHLQAAENICESFSNYKWYEELNANVKGFLEYKETPDYIIQSKKSKLETKWISGKQNQVQKDVEGVYLEALFYSATVTGEGSGKLFIEASSFQQSKTKVYPYKEYYSQRLREKT